MKKLWCQAGLIPATARCHRLLSLLMLLAFGSPALAAPLLGAAQNFAVLGAATVTNTGASTVWGDLGLDPGTSMSGIPMLTLTGTEYLEDALAQQAQHDAALAYVALAGQTRTRDLSGVDLGGLSLVAGVYFFASSAQLTGTLTLDAQGDPNALFVFQIGSTLTTAGSSAVNIINGGSNNGVFWQVGSSATLGTSTLFAGNILAEASITLNTAAKILCGRAIALTGALTMDSNVISDNCSADSISAGNDYGSLGFSAAGIAASPAAPEPTTLALLGLGLSGLIVRGFQRRRSGRGHRI